MDTAIERNAMPADPQLPLDMTASYQARACITPAQYGTSHLPPSQQFDAWARGDETVFDLMPSKHPQEGFLARRLVWKLDGLLLVQNEVPGHHFQRTRALIRKDPTDHWFFMLQRSGIAEVASDERITRATPGKLAFRSLAQPFKGTRADSETSVLFVPRDHFWQLAPAFDGVANTILDTPLGLLLCDYLRALDRQLAFVGAADIPRISSVTRAMISACMAPSQDRIADAAPPLAATLSERARQYVDANLRSPSLSPDRMCRAVGVSRRTLYNLFERYGGVARYIRRQRLMACHAAFADPLETRHIQTIAEEYGFTNSATFSRAFRAEFGYSAREAKDARTAGAVKHPDNPAYLLEFLRAL